MTESHTIRLTVNIDRETYGALLAMAGRENITITEAERRLVTYGDVVYRAIKNERKKVYLETPYSREEFLIPEE